MRTVDSGVAVGEWGGGIGDWSHDHFWFVGSGETITLAMV